MTLSAFVAVAMGIAACGEDEEPASTESGTSDGGSVVGAATLEVGGETIVIQPPEVNETCTHLKTFVQRGPLDLAAKLAGPLSRGRIDDEIIGLGTLAAKVADAQCPEYLPADPVIEQLNTAP